MTARERRLVVQKVCTAAGVSERKAIRFIDDHREEYGVEPICAVLPIAPSTYYAHRTREADPDLRATEAKRDEELKPEFPQVWDGNYQV